MKSSPKLVLALLALAYCAAGAQTVYSGQADQERRERNREEAMSHYRSGATTTTTTGERRETVREEAREVKEKTRRGAHKVADSTRRVAHKSANTARRVGHKVAVKARESTARADAKFGTVPKRPATGEGAGMTTPTSTAPTK